MILRHTTIIVFLLYSGLSLICTGCAPKTSDNVVNQPTQEQEQPQAESGDKTIPKGHYTHTVKLPGESLSIIAKWFTGDLKNWETLAEHNPEINPNRIHLGDKIKIPRQMMTRHDPMTLQFVEESQPKAKRPRRKPTAAQKKPVVTEPTATAAEQKTVPDEVKPEEVQPKEVIEEDEPFLFGPRDYQKN